MRHAKSPSTHLLSAIQAAAPIATRSNVLPSSPTSPRSPSPYALQSNPSASTHTAHTTSNTLPSSVKQHSRLTAFPASVPTTQNESQTSSKSQQSMDSVNSTFLPLSQVSEKQPSTSRQPASPTASASTSRHYRSRSRNPCYPPNAHEMPAEPGCLSCNWFSSLPPKVRLWLSFAAWGATSVGFIIAVAFWKAEVFNGLDELSHWLVAEQWTGYAITFFLIFLTTIPPLPLYSTLMILSGYTYGTWTGFVLSYSSSLFGAIVVFGISRKYLGNSLVSVLAHSPGLAKTVRAISRNPKLLFLVRLAPYPYNVMNVLLAACPSLTMRRYVGCTGVSLLKVVIHTSIGAGIHSFAGYYGVGEEGSTEKEDSHSDLAKWSTGIGVGLCIVLFAYLSYIARKAVDDELEGEEGCDGTVLPVHTQHRGREALRIGSRHTREASTAEERMAFLSPIGDAASSDSDDESGGLEMGERSALGVSVSRSPSFELRR